ncbi:hypothetical protein AAVH_33311, partial [Aphelenchoides avenae]
GGFLFSDSSAARRTALRLRTLILVAILPCFILLLRRRSACATRSSTLWIPGFCRGSPLVLRPGNRTTETTRSHSRSKTVSTALLLTASRRRPTIRPQQGIPAVGSFNQPACKPMVASTGQQALSENNAYAARPPQLGIDASDFFSITEQELDEVLASLADHQPTSQQKIPPANAAASQAAQFFAPLGAAHEQQSSSHPATFGTVSNAPPVHGNARKTPATPPTNGAQASHISVPVGAEVLEVRELPLHPGAYEVVTTAGTFRAYGQAPVVDRQPQRQPQ